MKTANNDGGSVIDAGIDPKTYHIGDVPIATLERFMDIDSK